jgi:hypothetical protein
MDVPADLIITIDDVKKAGFCAGFKTRRWFIDHGFDYQAFIRDGVLASTFLEKGDALAVTVVERTMARKLVGASLDGVMITTADAEAAGKCHMGSRAFARRNGLDFAAYLKTGIPAEELVATGDPDALAVVRHKVNRRG